MVYDAENRLVSINSGSATYSYDGKSLRVQKAYGGTTTVYIFSGTRVLAE
jgi:YD repeat-containing protein